jgi:hypothetical protein
MLAIRSESTAVDRDFTTAGEVDVKRYLEMFDDWTEVNEKGK